MSETIEAPVSDGSNDFDEAVKSLGLENVAPTSDDTSDGETALEQDLPDGVPPKDTLKVNGKETEHSYTEIKAMAQKYAATELKLEQAKNEIAKTREMQTEIAGQQQAVKNLLQVLKSGDLETIGNFADEYLGAGREFQQGVIEYALKIYEYSKMSPEQRESMDNKKLLNKMRQEAETKAQQDQQRAFEYQINQWSEHIASEIPKAMKAVGLPDTPFVREHLVGTWRSAIEQGRNPTATAVAEFVKKRMKEANMQLSSPAPATPQRPRATKQSVANRNGQATEPQQQYMGWAEWQKSRKS